MVRSTSHLGVVRKIIFLVVVSIVLVIIRNQYFTGRTQYTKNTSTPFPTNLSSSDSKRNKTEADEINKEPREKAEDFEYAFPGHAPGVKRALENHTSNQNYSYTGLPQSKIPLDKRVPQIVLIVAYMHTGSSYLGELLQQHPKTFYLFEPLRPLRSKTNGRRTVKYLDGTEVRMSDDLYTHVGAQSLVDMLLCNYSNLDITTLVEKHRSEKSRHDYYSCLKQYCNNFNRGRKTDIDTNRGVCTNGVRAGANFQEVYEAINKCLPKIVTKCENSNMRAIKIIRMSMEMTELVLRAIPNMRIIHLLRDPRAMLDSNARKRELGVGRFSGYKQRTKYMCDRMTRDFRTAEHLEVLYPGKIFTLRYEDMVEDPIGIAKNVYNFIQIPFTNVVKKFVRRTSIDSARNSTIRANTWRYHIDADQVNVVESICDDLFKMLGYKKLDNLINVRNLTITDHEREINIS